MKPEQLKLYNKYNYINIPNIEYIYIGIDTEDFYCFLYKNENTNTYFSYLKFNGLEPDKIAKDLNLEIFIDYNNSKYIKDYNLTFFSKNRVETYLKSILKNKLNNIINR